MGAPIDDLLQIIKLLIVGPFFALLIAIDRYIFASIRNPFVAFPRSVKELAAHPKDFFDFIAANCVPGTLPRGAKFLRMENRGGAEWEPDKSVVKARIFYTDPSSSSSSGQQQQQLDIFVKMPTAREYGVLFKTLISVFSTETKEIQFYNTVWPELNMIARQRKILSADGKEELFNVPQNIVSKWSRLFERSVAVSHCLDDSKWHSRPDWKDADGTSVVPTMITRMARMHALTFDCATKNSRYQPDAKVFELRQRCFSGDKDPTAWLESVLKLYLPSAPNADGSRRMWEAVVARCKSEPMVVAHSDFRMGNMLFNSDYSDVIVTDWEANATNIFAWDLCYGLFCGYSPTARRERAREAIQLYVDCMKKNGIVDCPSLEIGNVTELYTVCMVILHYFSWVLTKFGGVGQSQGNSSGDVKSWGIKVGEVLVEALEDCAATAKALRCDPKIVEDFKKEVLHTYDAARKGEWKGE